jgi:hypothetical protein
MCTKNIYVFKVDAISLRNSKYIFYFTFYSKTAAIKVAEAFFVKIIICMPLKRTTGDSYFFVE